jgi:hypothetical protein
MNIAVMAGEEVANIADLDPIEEIRLRTWARMNYAPEPEREDDLHPVILDEMIRMDRET